MLVLEKMLRVHLVQEDFCTQITEAQIQSEFYEFKPACEVDQDSTL